MWISAVTSLFFLEMIVRATGSLLSAFGISSELSLQQLAQKVILYGGSQ